MRVKICGITSQEDAEHACAAGADFVGLIRAESKRRCDPDVARHVCAALPASCQPVLVFRDAVLDDLLADAARAGCGWVQLHGDEPVAYVQRLQRERPDLRLIRAWEVRDRTAGDALVDYLEQAALADVHIEIVLLDSPKHAPHPGYDTLAMISRRVLERPPEIWCAGRLGPENLAEAVADGRYDGVDVASGVELLPGRKDHAKVAQFINLGQRLS